MLDRVLPVIHVGKLDSISIRSTAFSRQHPLDYLESLEKCITTALAELTEEQKDYVIGIGVDTTGSTPVPGR